MNTKAPVSRQYWIDHLRAIKGLSDDPDMQTACLLVAKDGHTVIAAANGVPSGVVTQSDRLMKPAKYEWVMHAERKVIAKAAKSGFITRDSTAFLNWFPCSECASSLIEAGVKVLDAEKDAYETRRHDPRYGFTIAMEMLREAKVEIRWHR